MLYIYKVDNNPNYDEIIVNTLRGGCTSQMYYKNTNFVKRDIISWDFRNFRINRCNSKDIDIIIIPPELDVDFPVRCVGSNAFKECGASKVVVLGEGRLSLEKDAFEGVDEVYVYSYVKASEVADNVYPLGRVLNDI